MTFSEFFNGSEPPKFLKAAFYGGAGSGRSRTAYELVKGLVNDKGLVRRVAWFDTGRGTDWLLPLFRQAGIECLVRKSRSFTDLMQACRLVEGSDVQVMVVDSITDMWSALKAAYLRQYNADRRRSLAERYGGDWTRKNFRESLYLSARHRGQVRSVWTGFTDFFLNSSLHIVVCGRAGNLFPGGDNGSPVRDFTDTPAPATVEKVLGYEPSLLVEMRPKYTDGRRRIFGYVEKDRLDTIQGMEFELPGYADFKPHIDSLCVGGRMISEMGGTDPAALFEGRTLEPEDETAAEKRRRTILCEEIKGLLGLKVPGQSAGAKLRRDSLMAELFGTLSWTRMEATGSDRLQTGLNRLKGILSEE